MNIKKRKKWNPTFKERESRIWKLGCEGKKSRIKFHLLFLGAKFLPYESKDAQLPRIVSLIKLECKLPVTRRCIINLWEIVWQLIQISSIVTPSFDRLVSEDLVWRRHTVVPGEPVVVDIQFNVYLSLSSNLSKVGYQGFIIHVRPSFWNLSC